MNKVHSLPEFTDSFQYKSSKGKKVMIVTVDEGPDEIPSYIKLSTVQLIILMSTILMYIL